MATIYLYGEFGWEITAQSVRGQLDKLDLSNETELEVRIFSPGGDVREGFAVKNILLSTGLKLITVAEGLVGSIATIPFLAGDVRKMMDNTEFFIHHPSGGTYGTTEDLEAFLQVLRDKKEEILNYYHSRSGQAIAALDEWMTAETSFTPVQALELGFATELIKQTEAASAMTAMYKNSKTDKMSEEKVISSLYDKIMAKISPKALKLSTASGELLEITTAETDAKEGDSVKMKGGSLEDGAYPMQDGRTFEISNGKITKIVPAPEMISLEDVVNLVKSIKAEHQKETNERLEKLEKENIALKAQITSNYSPPRSDEHEEKIDPENQLITKEQLVSNIYAEAMKAAVKK